MQIVEFYLNKMNLKVIIPAHLASLRLKEKILIDIHGLPMIEHVRRRALISKQFDEVVVCTCDLKIKKVINNYNGKVIMTSRKHGRTVPKSQENRGSRI